MGLILLLDFSGYLAATAANLLFSFTVTSLGWSGIVLMWCGITVIGSFAAFFTKKRADVNSTELLTK